jgi:hypothetical protein
MRAWCNPKFFVRNLIVLGALLIAAGIGVYESGVSAHTETTASVAR